ncbi:MAG: AhpC/TSA family protein [Pedobacter sp.]|nr:AhpC/TSA family protein [Pedobacter sp.]
MKNLSYMLFLVATFVVGCKDTTKFMINGKVENFGSENKVYLYGMSSNTMSIIDSTVLSSKGEFKFSRPSAVADFFRIHIGKNEYMLIAKNGDNIDFTADINDANHDYKLTGADEADKLTEFNTMKFKSSANLDKIKADFDQKVQAAPENRDALLEQIRPQYMNALNELNANVIKFAQENTKSLVSFYAISAINPTGNEKALVKYAETVDEAVKKNVAVKSFVERVNKLKSLLVGQIAPNFSINSIGGQKIELSQFKGKYVLLDFWASWCGPCRAENPNVVKAYQTYKNRNFTILGISLDKDKAAWAQAIKQDGLTWTHAGELADFEGSTVQLYQVQAIPASFLLDPSGKIIARDLRGEELDAFLNKTLP